MRATTGDSPVSVQTKSVSLAPVAIVTLAQSADPTDPINIYALSGKEAGTVITIKDGTSYYLAMAQGSAPDDAWVAMGGSSGSVPNATTSVRGLVLQSAATADQGTLTVAGADVAALVTSTNTALATLVAKVNAILAAERTAGQKATS